MTTTSKEATFAEARIGDRVIHAKRGVEFVVISRATLPVIGEKKMEVVRLLPSITNGVTDLNEAGPLLSVDERTIRSFQTKVTK